MSSEVKRASHTHQAPHIGFPQAAPVTNAIKVNTAPTGAIAAAEASQEALRKMAPYERQDILNHCKLIHCEIPAQGVEPYVGTPSYEEYMKFFNDNGFIYSTRIKDHMINRSILVQHDYFFMKEIVQ